MPVVCSGHLTLPTGEKLQKGLTLESSNKIRAGVSSLMLTSNEKQPFYFIVSTVYLCMSKGGAVCDYSQTCKWVKIKMSASRKMERDC